MSQQCHSWVCAKEIKSAGPRDSCTSESIAGWVPIHTPTMTIWDDTQSSSSQPQRTESCHSWKWGQTWPSLYERRKARCTMLSAAPSPSGCNLRKLTSWYLKEDWCPEAEESREGRDGGGWSEGIELQSERSQSSGCYCTTLERSEMTITHSACPKAGRRNFHLEEMRR